MAEVDAHNRTPQRFSISRRTSNAGGVRQGAGRPKLHMAPRVEREIRIAKYARGLLCKHLWTEATLMLRIR